MENFLATLHQLLQEMKIGRTEKIWKTKFIVYNEYVDQR